MLLLKKDLNWIQLIVIKDQVKRVRNYTAVVRLHKEVSVEIPFEVIAE